MVEYPFLTAKLKQALQQIYPFPKLMNIIDVLGPMLIITTSSISRILHIFHAGLLMIKCKL